MVRFIRTNEISFGVGQQAMAYAQKVIDRINQQNPNCNARVFIGRGGPVNALYWMADFDDLAAYDAWYKSIVKDQELQEISKEALDNRYFVEGSTDDQIIETLDAFA